MKLITIISVNKGVVTFFYYEISGFVLALAGTLQ